MLLYSFTKVGRGKGFKSQLWLFSFTEEYFQVIKKKIKIRAQTKLLPNLL